MEELATGNRVGPYTLLFRLGKGGMGEVWCASSGSSSGHMGDFLKLVALKLLRDAEEGSNSSVMFFDEAKVAAALQHASIVPTLDLGQAKDTYYLAMEMVRGPSLTALLQHLALKKMVTPPAVVAYIGERIASALDYANARAEIQGKKLHLVHRDISPHNVLLDQSGNVVLSDFGVARTAVQDHLSRVGTVRGKPSYMAPEQVNGGDIDGRTDVFALGTVLYETACVKRLFGRGKPLQSMQAVLTFEPQPLAEKVPGFPKELADVIHKALEKNPDDRFQSASEMVQALTDCSRKLPGSSTVQRDLADLIAKLFPGGSFDVEGKAREAISSLGEMTHSGADLSMNGLSPMVQPSSMQQGDVAVPTALSGRYAAPVVWPTSSHADPLADEALAEVRQEQTRLGYFQTDGNFTPMSNTGPGSVDYYQPLGIQPEAPKTTTWILAGVVVIGLLGLGAGALLVARNEPQASVAPTKSTTSPEPTPPGIRVEPGKQPAQPVATAGPREPEPQPATTTEPADNGRTTRPGRTSPPPKTKPPAEPPRTEPPPVEKAAAPKPKKSLSFEADQAGLMSCAGALKARGLGDDSTRVKMGVAQANGNPEALRRLLGICMAALNSSGE